MIYLLGSIFILGWKNVGGYPEALKYGEIGGQVTGVSPETQQNIRGQLVCLLHSDGPEIHKVVSVLWILGSLVLAYIWYKNRKAILDGNNRLFMYLGSITLLALLITSPTHINKTMCLWCCLQYGFCLDWYRRLNKIAKACLSKISDYWISIFKLDVFSNYCSYTSNYSTVLRLGSDSYNIAFVF